MSDSRHQDVDWRTVGSAELQRQLSLLNDTTSIAAVTGSSAGDEAGTGSRSTGAVAVLSRVVGLEYDSRGAAVYVCSVISVYAACVVLFVALLFAVRRRRISRKWRREHGDVMAPYVVSRRQYGVQPSVLPPPPPPPPVASVSYVGVPGTLVEPSSLVRLRSSGDLQDSDGRRLHRGRLRAGDHRQHPRVPGMPRYSTLGAIDCGHLDLLMRRDGGASPVDDFITLIQVEPPLNQTQETSVVVDDGENQRASVTSDSGVMTSAVNTPSTTASALCIKTAENRCRWSTGNNGDIWVLQIEPEVVGDVDNGTVATSVERVTSPDIDECRHVTPSTTSSPQIDDGLGPMSSSSSSLSSAKFRDLNLVDLSVSHVIKCCRQPPWSRLLPVERDGVGLMPLSTDTRRTSSISGSESWQSLSVSSATDIQSPAELQRLLHVTSV